MRKYRVKEYLILHWDVPLFDFTKDQAHMEWHIEERKNIIFWKTLKIFRSKTLAEQELSKKHVENKSKS